MQNSLHVCYAKDRVRPTGGKSGREAGERDSGGGGGCKQNNKRLESRGVC